MLALALTLLPAALAADPDPILVEGMLCHPSRLLVKVASSRTLRPSPAPGMATLRVMSEIGWAVVQVPQGRLLASRSVLSKLPGVLAVSLDKASRPAYDPNDPLWPDMWHMRAIKADLAWDHSFGSPDVTVAVIDTGVFDAHPDLAANIWNNPGEIPGNSIDDDSNGYVDDIVGYDFAYSDPEPDDVYGHGTACAGLVAAVQDNSIGVTGVAPNARIMCLKASNDDGYFFDSMTVPAYLYAANNGAKVLSMSYFSDHVTAAERDAINFCWTNGVLPVAAAGNSSSVIPYYPGAYENTLGVAAVGGNLLKAGFSNYGTWVDVCAPGTGLRTTSASGGYTNSFGGTSGATPHVAGLAALLFGSRPGATAREVRNAIEDTATNIDQSPFGEFSNYGLIDAEAAVLAILNGDAPARSPRVRYITPIGNNIDDVYFNDDIVIRARVYGRGLQAPRQVLVTIGGQTYSPVQQTRDFVDVVYEPPVVGRCKVTVDGQLLADFQMPQAYRRGYPLIEASAPGAAVNGGFFEALLEDGNLLTCTRRDDGLIQLQGVFRRVDALGKGRLSWRRFYSGSPTGTENVYLYDWSSGSYPYGNWVNVSSASLPGSATTRSVNIANLAQFVDTERTLYVRILTTDNLPDGTKLNLDFIKLMEIP